MDDLELNEYIFHTTHTGKSGCVGEKNCNPALVKALFQLASVNNVWKLSQFFTQCSIWDLILSSALKSNDLVNEINNKGVYRVGNEKINLSDLTRYLGRRVSPWSSFKLWAE